MKAWSLKFGCKERGKRGTVGILLEEVTTVDVAQL